MSLFTILKPKRTSKRSKSSERVGLQQSKDTSKESYHIEWPAESSLGKSKKRQSGRNFAEMLDDDNMAWGPPRSSRR
ncbi:hypothetical protein CERSUDRAFT_110020 [Gelatoporia subvermispora B]|uniref:Uncharacterized protein n=1 Tax=Ceriporiopsis subvermispora (strain B) TaxID=914234 RepID=M2QWI4_CERS8|nr:hypothetical protein CERSUDRAFT_110020 [Gelatoporia subvermispora B]